LAVMEAAAKSDLMTVELMGYTVLDSGVGLKFQILVSALICAPSFYLEADTCVPSNQQDTYRQPTKALPSETLPQKQQALTLAGRYLSTLSTIQQSSSFTTKNTSAFTVPKPCAEHLHAGTPPERNNGAKQVRLRTVRTSASTQSSRFEWSSTTPRSTSCHAEK
jgi:hypothetical protein